MKDGVAGTAPDELRQVRETASYWCVVMSSGEASAAEKERFADWITRHPLHLREFRAVEALWVETKEFGPALDATIDVIRLFPPPSHADESAGCEHGSPQTPSEKRSHTIFAVGFADRSSAAQGRFFISEKVAPKVVA